MHTALLSLAALSTVLLAVVFIDFAMGRGRVRVLKDVRPAETGPPLSIVAAARNEARGIEAAVTSLLRLDYPALEIVIVNDRSTDDTGAILERLSADVSADVGSGFGRMCPPGGGPDTWVMKRHLAVTARRRCRRA